MQNVLTKFKWMTDQKNTLVFVLIVRWLWKLFRLPKQCLHWCNGAKKHWMTFPPTILWDSSGSPRNETTDEITKEGTVHQFAGPEPTLGVSRQITTRRIKCWIDDWHMAIWLENWFWGLVLLLGLGYCPLTECNPGLLLASLPDTTPREDIST